MTRSPIRETAVYKQVRTVVSEDGAARPLLPDHYGNDIDGLDKVFVLGILGGSERSLIRLAAQLFDSRLQIRICTKVKKRRSRFRRQRFG